MPPPKRASSVLNGSSGDHPDGLPQHVVDSFDADDAQAMAEEAEADAVAAEAAANAALARARAVKLRRQANASVAAAAPVAIPLETVDEVEDSDENYVVGGTDEATYDEDVTDGVATEQVPAKRRRLRLGVPRIRLAWVAATLVVVCILGFLGAGGYVVWQHRQAVAEQQRTAEFAAAARQGVVTLMSLNFNNAEDDVKRIIDNTTGDFKKDFEGQSEQFAAVAKQSKVVTEAAVNATAVQTMTKDTATVLVAVTTQVANTASQQQQPRSWRLRVDLARDGGQLKLAKVEFVP